MVNLAPPLGAIASTAGSGLVTTRGPGPGVSVEKAGNCSQVNAKAGQANLGVARETAMVAVDDNECSGRRIGDDNGVLKRPTVAQCLRERADADPVIVGIVA